MSTNILLVGIIIFLIILDLVDEINQFQNRNVTNRIKVDILNTIFFDNSIQKHIFSWLPLWILFFQGVVTMKRTLFASTHICLPISLNKNFGLPGILKVSLRYSLTLLRKQK